MPYNFTRTVPDIALATDHWKISIHRLASGTSQIVLTYFPADGGKPLVGTLEDAQITAAMKTAGRDFAQLVIAAVSFQERG